MLSVDWVSFSMFSSVPAVFESGEVGANPSLEDEGPDLFVSFESSVVTPSEISVEFTVVELESNLGVVTDSDSGAETGSVLTVAATVD